MSATATHFSMELALEPTSVWVIICDATRLLIFKRKIYKDMYWLFKEGSGGGGRCFKKIKKAYIIEVLTGFHYVWRPFCFIDLHPALAQELS